MVQWIASLVLGFLSALISQLGAPPNDLGDGLCDSVTLDASREYSPTVWNDAVVDPLDPLTFAIPAVLPVIDGNAGNKSATLLFSLAGGSAVECTYAGGAPSAHPTAPDEVLAGLEYVFSSCDDGSSAGSLATADHFELHVHNGDSWLPRTEVQVLLVDATCELEAGPCAGETWGGITWLGDTVHVRADGDDAGDGSTGSPVATLSRAVELSRASLALGKKAIAIGPGTFDASLLLDDPADDDLWLMGCSAAETVLVGIDDTAPVLDFAGGQEVGVQAVSLQGGGTGLRMSDGATAYANDIAIVSTGSAGVRIDGDATLGVLKGVEVTDPLGLGTCGWGIVVEDGTALMRTVLVQGAVEVGVGVSDADLVMIDSDVIGTWQNGLGMLGRAVHAQGSFTAMLDAHFVDNFDAGMFITNPTGAIINRIVIEFTSAGITAAGGATGDGIVVHGSSSATVFLVDNVVYDSDRAGIVVDGVDTYVKGNKGSVSGMFPTYGTHAFKQGGATITGPQSGVVADLSATPIDLVVDPLTCN